MAAPSLEQVQERARLARAFSEGIEIAYGYGGRGRAAEDYGCNGSTITRWCNGDMPISGRAWFFLSRALRARGERALRVADKLDKALNVK